MDLVVIPIANTHSLGNTTNGTANMFSSADSAGEGNRSLIPAPRASPPAGRANPWVGSSSNPGATNTEVIRYQDRVPGRRELGLERFFDRATYVNNNLPQGRVPGPSELGIERLNAGRRNVNYNVPREEVPSFRQLLVSLSPEQLEDISDPLPPEYHTVTHYWGEGLSRRAGGLTGPIRVYDPDYQAFRYDRNRTHQPFLNNMAAALYDQSVHHSLEFLSSDIFTRDQEIYLLNFL